MSTLSRRTWFQSLLAFIVPVATPAAIPFRGTLTSDHPEAARLEVRDARGRKLSLVRAVNLEEGWVDQYLSDGKGKIKTSVTSTEAAELGDKLVAPKLRPDIFGYESIPVVRTRGRFTIHRRSQ